MTDFGGKVALITGGGRGLGRATALELAARGATVAVADRKLEGARETADLAREKGTTCSAYEFDQADSASVESCIAKVLEDHRQIDLLFANAGIGKFAPLVDMAKEDWEVVIQVNVNGTFYVCQAVAKHMVDRGRGGSMVFTASSGAEVIADQLGAYCASKAAIVMLMKHLASELGSYRIRCNAVMPGVVETGMTRPMLSRPEWQRMLVRETPVGRWGKAEDVAKLVTFLLSDDSAYITGEAIMIDGGSTLHGFPRWYALDYSRPNQADWEECFNHYPYGGDKARPEI